MEISEKLPGANLRKLTSSQEDSLARMSATPGDGKESTELDPAFGPSTGGSFTSFDRGTSSWRTSQACLPGEWAEFSGTWPKSGSMRNGRCYQLANLVPHIHESACSFWPTPRASARDNCGGSNARKKAIRNGTYIGRNANPNVGEWLMGFPMEYSDSQPLATPSCPKLPNG